MLLSQDLEPFRGWVGFVADRLGAADRSLFGTRYRCTFGPSGIDFLTRRLVAFRARRAPSLNDFAFDLDPIICGREIADRAVGLLYVPEECEAVTGWVTRAASVCHLDEAKFDQVDDRLFNLVAFDPRGFQSVVGHDQAAILAPAGAGIGDHADLDKATLVDSQPAPDR